MTRRLTSAYDVAIDIWWALSRGKRVLTLGNGGGGVLAMCAAAAGAAEVHVIERNRFLYRMTKQCVKTNADSGVLPSPSPIHLIDQRFELCKAGAEEEVKEEEGSGEGGDETKTKPAADGAPKLEAVMTGRADVILTDLIDHTGLGLGLLPAVDHAGRHLASPTATMVPSNLRVRAVLLVGAASSHWSLLCIWVTASCSGA